METLQNEILELLNKQLPGFYIEVVERKNYFGNDQYLKINIATSNYQINNVSGQYYNNISLSVSEDLELKFQVFGGNGGQCFYRSIDPNNPKEKYYALQRVKIPFRTPNKNKQAVLKSINSICIKYKDLLKETFESGLLRSEDLNAIKLLIYKN